MRRLSIPAGVEWELVVVNNHCTDDTDEAVGRHKGRLPIRLLHEPRPGKSHALNTAIAAIRGGLILWTDDDVLVDEKWLEEHVAASEAWPEASFFGGPVQPWFEAPPPSWLTAAWPRVSAIYAIREVEESSPPMDARFHPCGANFAIRTNVQRQFLYDARLGRVGPSEVRGEETDVIFRLLSAGHRGVWVPGARVRHFIPRERLTLDYLRRFSFGHGQTAALPPAHGLWQRTRLRTKIALNQAKYQIARRVFGPDEWIKYLTKASYYRGRLAAARGRDAGSCRAA
jgi:glycosyltransferase involved in cell wall biosynthesis